MPLSPRSSLLTEADAPLRRPRSAVLAAILVLALLRVRAQLEVLGPLDRLHALGLALRALKFQHNLLGRLGLLVEHRLGLTSEARLLLRIAPVALSLAGLLASLVLRYLVRRVFLALLAVGLSCLWDVDHLCGARASERKWLETKLL